MSTLDGEWGETEFTETDTGRQLRVVVTVPELVARGMNEDSLALLMGKDAARAAKTLLDDEDGLSDG